MYKRQEIIEPLQTTGSVSSGRRKFVLISSMPVLLITGIIPPCFVDVYKRQGVPNEKILFAIDLSILSLSFVRINGIFLLLIINIDVYKRQKLKPHRQLMFWQM